MILELTGDAGERGRHPGGTAHTNHALDAAIAAHEDTALLTAVYPSSQARVGRAAELAARGADPRRLLTDHAGHPLSVCRHPSGAEPTVTAASAAGGDCPDLTLRGTVRTNSRATRVIARLRRSTNVLGGTPRGSTS